MKQSILHSAHISLGAKFVDFHGWELPLRYSAGTLAEHSACRNDTAVFDVSHLGRLQVHDSEKYLQWRLTNDLSKLEPMQAQYTHILNAKDGSVLDDLICVFLGGDEYLLVINAANYEKVVAELKKALDIKTESPSSTGAFLAVQGPQAFANLKNILNLDSIKKNEVRRATYEDEEILVLGTGYTGESGVECILPESTAENFLMALVEQGAIPAGLGARDILRLEAGYPLHGQELGAGITPLQAQMEWVLAWEKGDFCGKEALEIEKSEGVKRFLWGLKIENDRRPLRAGSSINLNGQKVGEVTSGNFSPISKCAVGMGFLDSSIKPNSKVEIVDSSSRFAEVVETKNLLSPK